METQRNLACHACVKGQRRVLVSANEVLPPWTEIMHKGLHSEPERCTAYSESVLTHTTILLLETTRRVTTSKNEILVTHGALYTGSKKILLVSSSVAHSASVRSSYIYQHTLSIHLESG